MRVQIIKFVHLKRVQTVGMARIHFAFIVCRDWNRSLMNKTFQEHKLNISKVLVVIVQFVGCCQNMIKADENCVSYWKGSSNHTVKIIKTNLAIQIELLSRIQNHRIQNICSCMCVCMVSITFHEQNHQMGTKCNKNHFENGL